MSNFYRAVKVLNDVGEYIDYLEGNIAYVTALEAAGLLMPDLPEVNKGTPVHWTPEWEKHAEQGAEEAHLDGTNVFLDQGNQKTIALAKGSHIDHYGVGEARAVALALLAATDYAEKEQDNER